MNIESKEQNFLFNMLSQTYSSRLIMRFHDRGKSGYEYFLGSKYRIEYYAATLRCDLRDRKMLDKLKRELITYKVLHTIHTRKANRRTKKVKSKRFAELKTLMPEDIIRLISAAEITQYNDFFEHHPTIARVAPKKLIKNDKETLNRLRDETLTDIFESAYEAIKIRLKIEESLLENPKELYPAARSMKRKFIIHSGMTNTGKTYNAIAALKKAATGVYLGPLRLLAMEIQETLLMDNIMCNMKTGEEESIVPYATHISSTVEMADLYAMYDVAVIDECQMIANRDRGCAWTRAILGVRASEIHLCTAPDAVDILVKIIDDCGDKYEIIEYERRTPIAYDVSLTTDAKIEWTDELGKRRRPSCAERLKKINLNKLEYGDALIAFSRKDVIMIANLLKRKGIKASVIYGALPYATRKQQLKRFMNQETQVVVATDAIGMGLNLPIRRVIFTTIYKYDGEQFRQLKSSELKQIAGRAGRKGMYDKGYVYSVTEDEYVKSALEEEYKPIEKAYIDFDTSFIDIESGIRDILSAWTEADMPHDMYEKINVSKILVHMKHIEKLCQSKNYECDKSTEYRLATINFDDRDGAVFGTWIDYVEDYLSGSMELPYPRIQKTSIETLESSFKRVDLYYAFSNAMGCKPDNDWITNMKDHLADEINYRLAQR